MIRVRWPCQESLDRLLHRYRHEYDDGRNFVHRGIAARGFERKFELADYVQVSGATLENGLLTIDLVREVPESMRPRKIAIGGQTPVLEVAKAA